MFYGVRPAKPLGRQNSRVDMAMLRGFKVVLADRGYGQVGLESSSFPI